METLPMGRNVDDCGEASMVAESACKGDHNTWPLWVPFGVLPKPSRNYHGA